VRRTCDHLTLSRSTWDDRFVTHHEQTPVTF
jgi:hypothetical protein